MALLAQFPEAQTVILEVTPASVRVEATIVLRSDATAQTAAAIANTISSTSPRTMEADWFVGVTITSQPAAQVTTVSSALVASPNEDEDDEDGGRTVLIIVIAAVIVLVLLGVAVACTRRSNEMATTEVKGGSSSTSSSQSSAMQHDKV